MFTSELVTRLSTQITRWPRSIRYSQRWEPRKPAPPVTTDVGTDQIVLIEPETPGSTRTIFIPGPAQEPTWRADTVSMNKRAATLLLPLFVVLATAAVAAANTITTTGTVTGAGS